MHRTPLHYCAAAGDLESAKALIDAGGSSNIQDADFATPLHLAIDEDHDEIFDILVASKADVNVGNVKIGLDSSPLLDAAHKGNHELTLKLLDARADVNL